jgi:hypothetical protein
LFSLPLDFIDPPLFGRVKFSKNIIRKDPKVVNDDVVSLSSTSTIAILTDRQITFNTQGSSQWDSFRHFAYQKEAVFYNGVTQNDVHASGLTNPVNGLGG